MKFCYFCFIFSFQFISPLSKIPKKKNYLNLHFSIQTVYVHVCRHNSFLDPKCADFEYSFLTFFKYHHTGHYKVSQEIKKEFLTQVFYLDRFKNIGSLILIFISSSISRLFPKKSIIKPEDKKTLALFRFVNSVFLTQTPKTTRNQADIDRNMF